MLVAAIVVGTGDAVGVGVGGSNVGSGVLVGSGVDVDMLVGCGVGADVGVAVCGSTVGRVSVDSDVALIDEGVDVSRSTALPGGSSTTCEPHARRVTPVMMITVLTDTYFANMVNLKV